MISRLQEAFEAMRRFTADASHELQTPLTIMRSSVEVALERDRTPQEYRRVLADSLEEVLRMARIVGDLLLLARADAGALKLSRKPIPLDELTAEAVEAMRPLAEARGISLSLGSPGKLEFVGDERWLRQMLYNLIDNAIKYTRDAGEVSIGVASHDGSVLLTVTDRGPGISRGDQSRIFERFYRGTRPGGKAAGTGIGLSIALWIARSHGGDIQVDSQPGLGTTFRVVLPLLKRQESGAA